MCVSFLIDILVLGIWLILIYNLFNKININEFLECFIKWVSS